MLIIVSLKIKLTLLAGFIAKSKYEVCSEIGAHNN